MSRIRSKNEVVGGNKDTTGRANQVGGTIHRALPSMYKGTANTEVQEGAAEPRPYPRPPIVGLKDRGQHVILSLPDNVYVVTRSRPYR
jgi:hypothetical protein